VAVAHGCMLVSAVVRSLVDGWCAAVEEVHAAVAHNCIPISVVVRRSFVGA
jgi:hypothetical protein